MKPRVLFISNTCFSSYANNGKTFKSIFSDYSSDEIAQIFFTENDQPDFTFCNKFFLIKDQDVLKNIFAFRSKAGNTLPENYICPKRVYSGSSTRPSWLGQSFLRLLRDVIWSFQSWRSRGLLDFATKFDPDIIFFVGGPSKFSHDLALFLKTYLDRPLVVYFTDDYLLYPKVHSVWDWFQKCRMLRFYRKTINEALVSLTVGSKMSRVYSLFFKRRFETIMNSVPLRPLPAVILPSEVVAISYFGGLHTNRWKMIERLGHVISRGFPNKLILNVYTTETPEDTVIERFKNAGVQFKGSVFGAELIDVMIESDVLLHVESDDEYSCSNTRLSVSTKIPEYLMTGKPILGFGPKQVASMELLASNNIGLFIDSRLQDVDIKRNLEAVLDNKIRNSMGLAGYQFAIRNFDNDKNILRMRTILNKYERIKG